MTINTTTKFVIVGTQRTGTTLLRTSLSSHPEINCLGEVFKLGKKPYREVGGYWQFRRRHVRERVRAIIAPRMSTQNYLDELYLKGDLLAAGFKLMLTHCTALPHIWPQLVDQNVKVIHMQRRNLLKTLVSRQAAAQSGVYHVSGSLIASTAVDTWRASMIRIDTSSLLSDLEAIEQEFGSWKTRIGDKLECFDLVFEEYVRQKEAYDRKLVHFLGVRDVPLVSDLEKVNPDTLSDVVENHAEVASVLRNTRYECFLAIEGG